MAGAHTLVLRKWGIREEGAQRVTTCVATRTRLLETRCLALRSSSLAAGPTDRGKGVASCVQRVTKMGGSVRPILDGKDHPEPPSGVRRAKASTGLKQPTGENAFMTDTTAGEDNTSSLRTHMVDVLVHDGHLTDAGVERAMRTVPRHWFAPGADLETVHDPYQAVITKRDENEVATSSVSAPQIQAMMLEQAALRPGERVLEVGSGGYNAALIAELVGPEGEVTTVDIDPEVTELATHLLKESRYDRVRVITADADDGVPGHGPYDRIIITAGAWDIAPGWIDQLTADGRLVVPLRMRNLTRSLVLMRQGDHLVGEDPRICGFVPMRGAGGHQETQILLRGNTSVALRFDDHVPIDPHALDAVLLTERSEVWTGVTLAPQELISGLQMYLATTLPGYCTLAVDPEQDAGPIQVTNPRFTMAAVDTSAAGANFAYLITRKVSGRFEYGVHAFGSDAPHFAEVLADRIREWERDHRNGPEPHIELYPTSTPIQNLPGQAVITKRHWHIAFTWPSTTPDASNGHVPSNTTEGE